MHIAALNGHLTVADACKPAMLLPLITWKLCVYAYTDVIILSCICVCVHAFMCVTCFLCFPYYRREYIVYMLLPPSPLLVFP